MPDEPFSSPPGDYDATSCVEVSSPDDTSAQPDVQDEISDDSSDMNSGNQNQTMPEAEEKDQRTTFNAPAESASSIESLSVMTGTISGLERLIKRSFTSPESTKVACRALIESSDDKGLWLASLVQPAHLTEELRQGCSDLSTLVIMQWVRQGETHKLKQLGDILLVEEAAKVTHESAQIMVVLAGLLGILRPLLAQRLLAAATPHMIELSDNSLVQDARRWVEAGNILEGCIPEQRVFWNRRLREPNADWDWESTEARLALSHLSGKTAGEDADLDLFQNAVPGCWWDLWCSARTGHPATASAIASSQASNHSAKSGGFWAGLLVGTAAALGFGWFAMTQLSETAAAKATVEKPVEPFPTPAASKNEAIVLVEEDVPAPPVRESLRQLQAVLKREAVPAPAVVAQAPASAAAVPTAVMRAPSEPAASQSGMTKEEARKLAAIGFAISHADIKRLFMMVKEGSFRENDRLIQGMNSVAPGGSPAYKNLIHWLVLDPPDQADARLVVTKMAMRSMSTQEVVALFDLCHYPGSPNEIEVKQCSSLLLELPINDMTQEQKSKLLAIASAP